jgi:hypothetical protein
VQFECILALDSLNQHKNHRLSLLSLPRKPPSPTNKSWQSVLNYACIYFVNLACQTERLKEIATRRGVHHVDNALGQNTITG